MKDEDWYDLITEGTSLHDRWIAMMDDIAQYLQWLKDEGVEVLFRPLHEMNQGWYGFQRDILRTCSILHDELSPNHASNSLPLSFIFSLTVFGGADALAPRGHVGCTRSHMITFVTPRILPT